MAVRIHVRERELKNALEKATADGLAMATQHYHNQLKIVVNKPNTGTRVKAAIRRDSKGRHLKGSGKTRTLYDNPSAPGEPPKKRTGFGQRGIVREIDRRRMVARVGVTKNAIYMYYLETGTKHIARRPWLISTLTKHRRIMARLLVIPGRRL